MLYAVSVVISPVVLVQGFENLFCSLNGEPPANLFVFRPIINGFCALIFFAPAIISNPVNKCFFRIALFLSLWMQR